MAKSKKKKQEVKEFPKTKWFWAVSLLGVIGLVLGVFLLPVWDNSSVFWKSWGAEGVSIVLCGIITVYVLCYLCVRFNKLENSTLKIISTIEIAVLILIAIGCLLQQFNVFDFFGPCLVFGAVLWLRGFVNVVKAYLYRHTKKEQYPLWLVIVSVFMITAGAILVVKPIPGNAFIWFVSIALLLASAMMLIGGFLMIPKKQAEVQEK